MEYILFLFVPFQIHVLRNENSKQNILWNATKMNDYRSIIAKSPYEIISHQIFCQKQEKLSYCILYIKLHSHYNIFCESVLNFSNTFFIVYKKIILEKINKYNFVIRSLQSKSGSKKENLKVSDKETAFVSADKNVQYNIQNYLYNKQI